MGNTKYIWFAGEFKKDVEITEAKLIEWAHGTYACLKEDADGYLGLSKNVLSVSTTHSDRNPPCPLWKRGRESSVETDKKNFKWVQGMVHTYSISGAGLIDNLESQMIHGFIGIYDEDLDAYAHFDIYEGKRENETVVPSDYPPIRFPFTLNKLARRSGWTLNKPLTVTVEQYIQKETMVRFNEAQIYGRGVSIPEALDDLAQKLIRQFEFFLEEEKRETLGPLAQKKLATLKSFLSPVLINAPIS